MRPGLQEQQSTNTRESIMGSTTVENTQALSMEEARPFEGQSIAPRRT
jgi:hypothetical protein